MNAHVSMFAVAGTQVREEIAGWDFTMLRLYLEKEGVEDIEAKLVEYQRYMELNARFPDRLMPMSPPIDPVWHAHILITRDYRRFCEQAVGFFVEHKPCFDDEELERLMPDYLNNTLALYAEVFGEPAPAEYWPQTCVCKCCGTG